MFKELEESMNKTQVKPLQLKSELDGAQINSRLDMARRKDQ